MYRFFIEDMEWIIRFSPNTMIDPDDKQKIISTISQLGHQLPSYTRGTSFVVFIEQFGLVVCNIETIPSPILTVSNVIHKEDWYVQANMSIEPFDTSFSN